MKKKTKQHSSKLRRALLMSGIVLSILLTLAACIFVVEKIKTIDDVNELTGTSQIRTLVVSAVEGLKREAPIDYKTGDVYFPESRLYLPNPGDKTVLTYAFEKAVDDQQAQLSVSTSPIKSTIPVNNAQTTTELFNAVPALQSCSRGVKLVERLYSQSDDQGELLYTVTVSDGRKIYLYLERACPELKPIAEQLRSVRSY